MSWSEDKRKELEGKWQEDLDKEEARYGKYLEDLKNRKDTDRPIPTGKGIIDQIEEARKEGRVFEYKPITKEQMDAAMKRWSDERKRILYDD